MNPRPDADVVRAAIAAFPELACLLDLVKSGWRFTSVLNNGEVTSVHGLRVWPQGWADAIGVLYTTDSQGLRANHAGDVVWKREGGLVDVVTGLLELPAPDERLAPRLAIGVAPPLWTPKGY
jgi:hypothetical protein